MSMPTCEYAEVVHHLHALKIDESRGDTTCHNAIWHCIDWLVYNQEYLPPFCALDLSSSALH